MIQESGSKAADRRFAGPPKKVSPGRLSPQYWALYYEARDNGRSGKCAWCKKPSKRLVKRFNVLLHPGCYFKFNKNRKYVNRLPGPSK